MMKRRSGLGALALGLLALTSVDAEAMSITDNNLVNLLRDAESIVVGSVQSVTDDIDAQGIPYTEITLEIGESIRGDLSGMYTFRQFGLREARPTADGTKMMMPTSVFPRYEQGEDVVLFLYPTAEWTGLRTTVGLAEGKFTIRAGRVENEVANAGMFQNISVLEGVTNDLDNRILSTEFGAVNPVDFLSLVRRAVENRWIETCQMYRTDEGPNCTGQRKRPISQRPPSESLPSGTTSRPVAARLSGN